MRTRTLGREFRKQFLTGLRRLLSKGKLRLEGNVSWLREETQREAWLHELQSTGWNVFIEGPPHGKSKPTQVIKYLARYMSGGPLADSRLISHRDGGVTFWARSKDKANKSEPFTLRGAEFVRRWSMHCLPKGYTRSRSLRRLPWWQPSQVSRALPKATAHHTGRRIFAAVRLNGTS